MNPHRQRTAVRRKDYDQGELKSPQLILWNIMNRVYPRISLNHKTFIIKYYKMGQKVNELN
jgi:hypothetical protein